MLPQKLVLVDDDAESSRCLSSHLRNQGANVRTFASNSDLLADRWAYDFDFYVLALGLLGIDSIEVLHILRRRTQAGVLVLSGSPEPRVFDEAVTAGADMYLSKPVQPEQLTLAIKAVHRRLVSSQKQTVLWQLDVRASELIAPHGARIELSATDLAVMCCLLEANGKVVGRQALKQRLEKNAHEVSNSALNATIYRLRRRIEQAASLTAPLQSQSRVGYIFRAPLAALL